MSLVGIGVVVAAALSGVEDIRDIRGPVPVAEPSAWPWMAAGVAVLALFALWARKWLQKPQPKTAMTPYQKTLQELQEAQPLLQSGKNKEYCQRASHAIRGYLESVLGVRAYHQTTEEFLEGLALEGHSHEFLDEQLLKRFLEMCDLAKFAQWQPASQEVAPLHQLALDLVHDTHRRQSAAAVATSAEPDGKETR